MQIVVMLDNQKYVSKTTTEVEQSTAVKAMYEKMESLNKLQLDLEDGSVLLIGKDAVQRAAIIVRK